MVTMEAKKANENSTAGCFSSFNIEEKQFGSGAIIEIVELSLHSLTMAVHTWPWLG